MKRRAKGFTLVEIMIVVAIIGLLIAIALPNFMKARKKSVFTSAQASMKQIEANVENAKIDGVTIAAWSEAAISGAIIPDYLKAYPTCPGGGAWDYTSNSIMQATIDGVTFSAATTLDAYLAQ